MDNQNQLQGMSFLRYEDETGCEHSLIYKVNIEIDPETEFETHINGVYEVDGVEVEPCQIVEEFGIELANEILTQLEKELIILPKQARRNPDDI